MEASKLKEYPGLSEKDLEIIANQGYELLRCIGSGNTRDVWLAHYRKGHVDKLKAVKIPKKEINNDSICTLINLSKGDPNIREVQCTNEISHENISEIEHSFELSDDRVVNVEKYHEKAVSLEEDVDDAVRNTKPEYFKQALPDFIIKDVFAKLIVAVRYLHTRGILHRDIKPSNILVGHEGLVKLTDLQNAIKIKDMKEQLLPTRGGTQYTHPDLLNALIEGRNTFASKKTDIYALGATLYYALTGKKPFSYKIIYDDNGKEIDLGKSIIKIALENGKGRGTITEQMHQKNLETALKRISPKWKKLLRKCLSYKEGYHEIYGLESDFEKACKNKETLWEQFKRKTLIAGITGALTFLAGCGVYMAIWIENTTTPAPSIHELLTNKKIRTQYLRNYTTIENTNVIKQLKEYIDDAREHEPFLEKSEEYQRYKWALDYHLDRRAAPDKRLMYSILRSCMRIDKECTEKEYGSSRIGPLLLPVDFADKLLGKYKREDEPDFRQQIGFAIDYTINITRYDDTIDEIIARYFCSEEEIQQAIISSGMKFDMGIRHLDKYKASFNLLPKIEDNTLKEGYIGYLPKTKQELIKRAIALYLITDNEGNLKFDKEKPDARRLTSAKQ